MRLKKVAMIVGTVGVGNLLPASTALAAPGVIAEVNASGLHANPGNGPQSRPAQGTITEVNPSDVAGRSIVIHVDTDCDGSKFMVVDPGHLDHHLGAGGLAD